MASNNIKKEMELEFARDKRTTEEPKSKSTKPLTPEDKRAADKVRQALNKAIATRKAMKLARIKEITQ